MTLHEFIEFVMQIEIASAYGFLDWSGDNWPQPHPVLGIGEWDWSELGVDS